MCSEVCGRKSMTSSNILHQTSARFQAHHLTPAHALFWFQSSLPFTTYVSSLLLWLTLLP
jgi:hypothetical protein